MERSKASIRHCAIYTRKSSEEGLEQDFNSLDAQREACEAFIKSQAGEGWRLVKTAYSYGPSRATRDAVGVSGAQDRRGDRRRPPACGPHHPRNDPKNRTALTLERAGAGSRRSIAHGAELLRMRSPKNRGPDHRLPVISRATSESER